MTPALQGIACCPPAPSSSLGVGRRVGEDQCNGTIMTARGAVLLVCTEKGCQLRRTGHSCTARRHVKVAREGPRLHVIVPETSEELKEGERRQGGGGRRLDVVQGNKSNLRKATWSHGAKDGTAEGIPVSAEPPGAGTGWVWFPVDDSKDPNEGNLYGILWCVGRTAVNRGGLCLFSDLQSSSTAAVRVAMCWASGVVQSRRVGRAAGNRAQLYKANEELMLYVRDCESTINGSSIGVAAALGLLSMKFGWQPAVDVAVTGCLDLSGGVWGVGGLPGKLQACYHLDVDVFLVPSSSWTAFDVDEELPGKEREGLRAYARKAVRPYTTMLEAIRAVFRDADMPVGPLLVGAGLQEPIGDYWVGAGFSIVYLREADRQTPTTESLMVQVASLHRMGRGTGYEKGEVVVGGICGETMKGEVLSARAWVLRNKHAIIRVLQLPEPSWDWLKEDLLVLFASGAWKDMDLALYTAPIAVAMVSFFSGRASRRDTSVSGAVSPDDRWMCKQAAVVDEMQIQALQVQGFKRVVLTDGDAFAENMEEKVAQAGVEVLTASGVGEQQARGSGPDRPEYSFVAMLPHLMVGGGARQDVLPQQV